MAAKILALCLVAFRCTAAYEIAKVGQAPNEAFVDKLKALAAQLGSSAGATPSASTTTSTAPVQAEAAAAAAAIPSSTAVQAEATASAPSGTAPVPAPVPPSTAAAEVASAPAEETASAPDGKSGFMKSLDALKSMLGSQASTAVATPVVTTTASSSGSEAPSGIENELNAFKALLHPKQSSNVVMEPAPQPEASKQVATATVPSVTMTEPVPQPEAPKQVATAIVPSVTMTSAASKDEDEDEDDDEDDDADTLVNKMVDSTRDAHNRALLKTHHHSGAATNAQRVAKMATQYINHVPSHTMLNKPRRHTEPIRP